MIFKIPERELPFTQIDNDLINNHKLSGKAKWILIYLLSKPAKWRVFERDIINHSKDGRDAIRAGIQELVKQGYITRGARVRNDKGHFKEYQYEVHEKPTKPIKSSPESKDGLSNVGKPDRSNTNPKPKLKKGKIIHIHQDPFDQATEIHQAERVQEIFNQIVQ